MCESGGSVFFDRARAGFFASAAFLALGASILSASDADAQSGRGTEACLMIDSITGAPAPDAALRDLANAASDRELAVTAGRLAINFANAGGLTVADCLLDESARAATRARDEGALARTRFNQALLAARVTQDSDVSGSWFRATRGAAEPTKLRLDGLEQLLDQAGFDWRPRSPEQIVDLALDAARLADAAGLQSLAANARVLAVNESRGVLSTGDVISLLDEAAVAATGVGDQAARLRIAEATMEWMSADADGGGRLIQLAYEQLSDVLAEADSERIEVFATGLLGRLYGLRGRNEEALALTSEAVIGASRIEDSQAELEFTIQLGAVSEALGNRETALTYYDRARDMVELIRPALVERPVEAGEPTLRAVMAPALLARVDLLLRLDGDDPDVLRDARETLELMKLLELETLFAELCIRVGAGEIVALDALADDVAVVYPVLLQDRTEIILARREVISRHGVAVPGPVIEEAAAAFRQTLQRADTNQHRRYGQTLYDALVAPIRATLENEGIDTLVFAPDGRLRAAPIAAVNNDGRYLIEDFAVATALGLSLVDPQPFNASSGRAVIAGISEARSGLAPLPAVVSEVRAVSAAMPDAALLVDDDFTAETLQAALSRSDVNLVHIATHAQFSPITEESFLLAYDRRISLREFEAVIDSMQGGRARPIDLLMLSACETAVGDDRAVLGLAGAAYLAGARSVVGSLWQISDQSTSVLVTSFYDSLIGDGAGKADALREAQLSLLSEPGTAHPYHWSAFVVLGNWL